jgi:hypothetical protein
MKREKSMRKSYINLFFTAVITILLLSSSCISGTRQPDTTTIQKSSQQNTIDEHQDAEITCYIAGAPYTQKISYASGVQLKELFAELAIANAYDPHSFETQQLQHQILLYAEQQGLLPAGITADTIFTQLEKIHHQISLKQFQDPSPLDAGTSQQFFCNFVSWGEGSAFPIIILPRFIPIIMTPIPRLFIGWKTSLGVTSCGGLLSRTGFIASGQQQGLALGFWGIGFSIFLPPVMGYGMFGYSLYAKVTAQDMTYYPPNNPPVITAVFPLDGATNIPLSTTELSFHISDLDGDLMSYTVSTYPDIGGGNGNLKPDGTYTIPISGLKSSMQYTWEVTVTDTKETKTQHFTFNTVETPFNPFDEGWQYRKQITIQHTQITGDLTSFPVFIHIIDPDVQTKAQPNGNDILFMNGPGVATKLYHEIERYDTSNGELTAWVNILNLSSVQDTTLYMYYGNPESANMQMPQRVWNPSFAGVWHLEEFQDSTNNANHGSNHGTIPLLGKTGDARHFDGVDDYISVENDASLNFHTLNRFTVSFWMKRDRSNIYESVISKGSSAYTAGYVVQIWGNNSVYFGVYDGSKENQIFSNQKITDTNWYYITSVWDGSTMSIYINGVLDFSENIGTVSIADDSKPLEFGHHYGYMSGKNPFAGDVDEIQISNINRNQDWILTAYQNQQNPSGFFTIGFEEPHP